MRVMLMHLSDGVPQVRSPILSVVWRHIYDCACSCTHAQHWQSLCNTSVQVTCSAGLFPSKSQIFKNRSWLSRAACTLACRYISAARQLSRVLQKTMVRSPRRCWGRRTCRDPCEGIHGSLLTAQWQVWWLGRTAVGIPQPGRLPTTAAAERATVVLMVQMAQQQQSCTESRAPLQVMRGGNRMPCWLCRWQLQYGCSTAKSLSLLLHYRPDIQGVPLAQETEPMPQVCTLCRCKQMSSCPGAPTTTSCTHLDECRQLVLCPFERDKAVLGPCHALVQAARLCADHGREALPDEPLHVLQQWREVSAGAGCISSHGVWQGIEPLRNHFKSCSKNQSQALMQFSWQGNAL